MGISQDSIKVLKYLRIHGETELHFLCWKALGRKSLEKDPYFFQDIEELERKGLIFYWHRPSLSEGDYSTIVRLTPEGKAVADENQAHRKDYWVNEIRAWVTAVVAVVGLILSFIGLRA